MNRSIFTRFKKGHSVSQEVRDKLRIANTGKKLTEEHKKKTSESLMGHTVSEETRRKIGAKHRGKKVSAEARKKMSQAKKGKTPWNKGKKMSEQSKEKLSQSKMGLQAGNKHWNWKGGITPKHTKIRNDIENKLWRDSVFARDGYTCQKCMKQGVNINAHHILNFSDNEDVRTSISNGVTLCVKCHKCFHKKYGKRNNNKEQIDEYTNS